MFSLFIKLIDLFCVWLKWYLLEVQAGIYRLICRQQVVMIRSCRFCVMMGEIVDEQRYANYGVGSSR